MLLLACQVQAAVELATAKAAKELEMMKAGICFILIRNVLAEGQAR